MIHKIVTSFVVIFLLTACAGRQSTDLSTNDANLNAQPTSGASQDSSPQATSTNSANAKPVIDNYAHLKPEHRDVLKEWLKDKTHLRPAVEEIDNEMFTDESMKADREANIKFLRDTVGENAYQYYSVGDMSHDGKEDFAVLLVDTRIHADGYDRFEMAIFNAPLKPGMAPAYHEDDLSDISNCFINFNKSIKRYLFLGKFESDVLCATYYPKGKTYVFKDCMN